jgi:hypothetical protein
MSELTAEREIRELAAALALRSGAGPWAMCKDVLSALDACRKELAEWKNAIEDAAVVEWTLTEGDTPRQTVNRMLHQVSLEALDPRVSGEARKMVDRAEKAERERDEAIAEIGKTARQLGLADAEITKLRERVAKLIDFTEHVSAESIDPAICAAADKVRAATEDDK